MTIKRINTLGPVGTNCEKASYEWLSQQPFGGDCEVVTHKTLESAIAETVKNVDTSVAVGCVVYPSLHEVVFGNLRDIVLLDTFMSDTFDMVMARKASGSQIETIASHPAPRCLIDDCGIEILDATSNVIAADMCSKGMADACVTTAPSARDYGLKIIHQFGPIKMGFTVHGKREHLKEILTGVN